MISVRLRKAGGGFATVCCICNKRLSNRRVDCENAAVRALGGSQQKKLSVNKISDKLDATSVYLFRKRTARP